MKQCGICDRPSEYHRCGQCETIYNRLRGIKADEYQPFQYNNLFDIIRQFFNDSIYKPDTDSQQWVERKTEDMINRIIRSVR